VGDGGTFVAVGVAVGVGVRLGVTDGAGALSPPPDDAGTGVAFSFGAVVDALVAVVMGVGVLVGVAVLPGVLLGCAVGMGVLVGVAVLVGKVKVPCRGGAARVTGVVCPDDATSATIDATIVLVAVARSHLSARCHFRRVAAIGSPPAPIFAPPPNAQRTPRRATHAGAAVPVERRYDTPMRQARQAASGPSGCINRSLKGR
jgi:hypothetical protein